MSGERNSRRARVRAVPKVAAVRPAALRERRSDPAPTPGIEPAPARRRRASHLMWSACESILSAPSDPGSLRRAMVALQRAFDCESVSIHVAGATGELEPWSASGPAAVDGKLRAVMSVPLFRGDERVGALDLVGKPGCRWSPDQVGLIRTASGALGAALGVRIELLRLRHLPGRDTLTGLPDGAAFRTRLSEEVARARRHGVPVSVVTLDIDRFGGINEKYGRPTGDATLTETGLVLRLALRDSDIVARLGGNVFGLLLPETDLDSAVRCAERVRRQIEEHRFPRIGRITASAGVSSCPVDGADGLALLDQAERALGLAKKNGRRRVRTTDRLSIQ